MSVTVDVSEVRALARDLGKVAGRAVPEATKVVERGALNVKKDWQARWKGLAHAPSLASAVTYELKIGVGTIAAEVGPDKSYRQGALGNLIEFGSVKNAAHPGGAPALAAEEPRFIKALADIAGKGL